MQYTVFTPFFIFYDRTIAFVNNNQHKDVDFTNSVFGNSHTLDPFKVLCNKSLFMIV